MAKRWYSVSVLSNFEKRVAEQIRTAVAEKGLEEVIEECLELRFAGGLLEQHALGNPAHDGQTITPPRVVLGDVPTNLLGGAREPGQQLVHHPRAVARPVLGGL